MSQQLVRRGNQVLLGDLDDQGEGALQPGYEQLGEAVRMLEADHEAYLVMPVQLARSLQGWEWQMLWDAGARRVAAERL